MRTNKNLTELVVRDTVNLKITFIAKFQRKVPYLTWDENLSHEPPYFDSMRARQNGIITKHGFNALLFDDKPMDIKNSCVGMNHFEVTMTDGSYIGMQEFMITPHLRKTETELIIKNIPPETIISIISEIDREKYVRNNADLEDLYLKISPDNHPLENKIREAYRNVGFNLLQQDPTLSNLALLWNEAALISRLGLFNYTQRFVSTHLGQNISLSFNQEAIESNQISPPH